MSHLLFQVRSFITYWLNAVDAHSLHSPFFYDFYTHVVRPIHAQDRSTFAGIEAARRSLLTDHAVIDVVDLGAGSLHMNSPKRKISEIASHSLSSARFGQLYHRAITHYRAKHILELGTSLGISTLYLASPSGTQVTTIEGAPEIASRARRLFSQHEMNNITVVTGNLDEVLDEVIGQMPAIDFAFLDANHRYAPTLRYFDNMMSKVHPGSVVVLDDIHHSEAMHRAWTEIRKHPRTTGSVDLFRCGFVFFEPSLNSQHFVLQI